MNPILLHRSARVTIAGEIFEVGEREQLPGGGDGGWSLHQDGEPTQVWETEYLCSVITAIRFAPDWIWPHAA